MSALRLVSLASTLCFVAATTPTTHLFAQDSLTTVPLVNPADGHGLPGQRVGTEQWIVHFKTRSFNLDALRNAVRAGASADRVEAMIAQLEDKAMQEQQAFKQALRELGGDTCIHYWLINSCAIEVPHAQLGRVRALPNVARLEPNLPVVPLIKEATSSSNHNSDLVNSQGFTGKGIATAIVDTGLDAKCGTKNRPHRTFYVDGDIKKANRLLANRQVGSFAPDNTHPHGTGVAGIAAGGMWGSSGADNGHAPEAGVVGYSLSNSASGGSDVATMAKSWQMVATDAVRYKIKTANNSYSGGRNSNPLDAIQQSLDTCAHTMDVCIVVAAGNSASSTAVSQPAVNGISVGALTATRHTVATFSSRGPHAGVSGMFFPNISACGVNTVMPRNDNESADYRASGTSMAAPQVCGAATLIRAAVPQLTAESTKAILLATALDISSKNRSAPYNSRNAYGMGMLRDDMAMRLARKASQHGMAKVTSSAKTWQRIFPVSAGKTYRASIAWMRQVMTSRAWSNLDVEVRVGSTVVGSSKTAVNTDETVIFTPATSGAAIIRVTGVTIEKDSQDFGWAFTEATPAPFEAKFDTFGSGCRSASQSCQVVVSENWTKTAANETTSVGEIAILDYGRPELRACGLDIFAKSRSGSVQVTLGIREYDNSTGEPGKVLVSRKVTVTSTAMLHSVRFPEVTIPKGGLYMPFFDNADKIVLPSATSGTTHVHYELAASKWSTPQYKHNFRFRVHSNPGLKVPALSSSDTPILGKAMAIELANAPSSRPAVLAIGLSNAQWGAIKLPLAYANPCSLLVSLDVLIATSSNAAGLATVNLPIPNDSNLVRAKIYQQFLVADSVNAIGLIGSNAGVGTIGDF